MTEEEQAAEEEEAQFRAFIMQQMAARPHEPDTIFMLIGMPTIFDEDELKDMGDQFSERGWDVECVETPLLLPNMLLFCAPEHDFYQVLYRSAN